jgi:hypothetical protein
MMKSSDFLNLAVRLPNSSEEADLRTSVSRCYYGGNIRRYAKDVLKLPVTAQLPRG